MPVLGTSSVTLSLGKLQKLSAAAMRRLSVLQVAMPLWILTHASVRSLTDIRSHQVSCLRFNMVTVYLLATPVRHMCLRDRAGVRDQGPGVSELQKNRRHHTLITIFRPVQLKNSTRINTDEYTD